MSGRPRIGVMTRSASAKTAAATGSGPASSRPMLTYWLPWPGKRKASLAGGGPASRGRSPALEAPSRASGVSEASAFSALPSLSSSSSRVAEVDHQPLGRGEEGGVGRGGRGRRSPPRPGRGARRGSPPAPPDPLRRRSLPAPGASWEPSRARKRSPGCRRGPEGDRGAPLLDVSAPGTCSSSTRWKFVPPKP